ncbi:hypothetical protein BC826DRAFT_73169 [Russula brevipes]|nr:hypothetical protein BC826DRAFT_73169 [Russula brevipes]
MSLLSDPDLLIHSLRLGYLRNVGEDPYGPRLISFNPSFSTNPYISAASLADATKWPELAAPHSPPLSPDDTDGGLAARPAQHLGLPRRLGPQVHAHHPRPVPHGRARHERQRAPPRWLEARAERRLAGGGGGPGRCGSGHGGHDDVAFCLGWHYCDCYYCGHGKHGEHGEHDFHCHPRDRDGCHCVEVAAAGGGPATAFRGRGSSRFETVVCAQV